MVLDERFTINDRLVTRREEREVIRRGSADGAIEKRKVTLPE